MGLLCSPSQRPHWGPQPLTWNLPQKAPDFCQHPISLFPVWHMPTARYQPQHAGARRKRDKALGVRLGAELVIMVRE